MVINKDQMNIEEYVDQRRWLLNNGLVTDDVKNQLFFCGSIVHKDVQAIELEINPENKLIYYKIYVRDDLLKNINKYNKLSKSSSLIDMWLFKRLLKREGSLDFSKVLRSFVRDFCGPKWEVSVDVVDFNNYVDSLGRDNETDRDSINIHKQLN